MDFRHYLFDNFQFDGLIDWLLIELTKDFNSITEMCVLNETWMVAFFPLYARIVNNANQIMCLENVKM